MFLKTVYTFGYGDRSIEDFLEIIRKHGVERVIDVRKWSSSGRRPVYSYINLNRVLLSNRLDYVWIPELGGYRKFGVDIDDYGIANCFKSHGFRAYATYITMNSSVKQYLDKLLQLVSEKTSILMCCEKNPYRCHRKILADYLVAKNFEVIHIVDSTKVIRHKLSKCAVVLNNELKYY